jgi:NADPH:quinone reductase-like Zn-dependent oxidoreductase
METMKAVLCKKYGPPEVLQLTQCRKPQPKEDEVLIKIYATSVTNSDIFIRSSNVPLMTMIPLRLMIGLRGPRKSIIGEVFSGEIEYAGPQTKRFKVGEQVYGLTGFSLGAYADYKCMTETDSKQGCLAVMPKNTSFEEATSAAYGGLLAFQQLEKVNITGKTRVLIYGASSTTGTMAVQYAKYLGAEVTGVCGPANSEFVKSLGADELLDYTREESLKDLKIYDLVLDAVGRAKTSKLKVACMNSLTKNGKYLSIDGEALLLQSDRLDRITQLIEMNAIKPITGRIYDLEQIVEAHRYVELGHKRGNVAITVNTKA